MKRVTRFLSLLFGVAFVALCAIVQAADEQKTRSLFESSWNTGHSENEPAFQRQAIDANTIAIRQSMRTSFEAPFLYLLFGDEKAVLIDTGAEGADLRSFIDSQLASWAEAQGREQPHLVVMHTHGHSDHTAADSQFADRSSTTIVSLDARAMRSFFGIEDWPDSTGSLDLGGRIVEILPTPGHHDDHVMVFDSRTGILFTGDTIYPGRLFYRCDKGPQYEASIERVTDFVATHRVAWLLGAHVEMSSNPGQAFPQDDSPRVDEHPIELPVTVVGEINTALKAQAGQYIVQPFSEFMLVPHPADPSGKSPPNWCLGSQSVGG